MTDKMRAEFHAERRMITSMARAEGCWSEDEISEIRMELRDQYYEKIKYANRPLPSLPDNMITDLTCKTSDETLITSDTKEEHTRDEEVGGEAEDDVEKTQQIRVQLKE